MEIAIQTQSLSQDPKQFTPPRAWFDHVSLPGTRLHYVKTGTGPPLVMVPATVSLIRQWLPLAQFMGQRFTSYFFELPGHGQSTPYPEKFESRMVPETVEAFADRMGFDTFNLMGFSFGGLLALRTLERLSHRIDKVILLSPCLSRHALKWSRKRQWAFRASVRAMKNSYILNGMHTILNMGSLEEPLTFALSKFGKVDRRILKNKNAIRMPLSTLDVLACTMDEILHNEYQYRGTPFKNPCYFGMSIYDDILEYPLTEQIVRDHFEQITIQKLYLPYHQPPEPPTFEWLVNEYKPLLKLLD
jgi:pimeloyl-ACP methyl ester carboxylesterase